MGFDMISAQDVLIRENALYDNTLPMVMLKACVYNYCVKTNDKKPESKN